MYSWTNTSTTLCLVILGQYNEEAIFWQFVTITGMSMWSLEGVRPAMKSVEISSKIAASIGSRRRSLTKFKHESSFANVPDNLRCTLSWFDTIF